MQTAIINAIIITLDQQNQIIKDGCLVFEGNTIQFVGDKLADLSNYDRVIDAKGNIVMPGLINTHGHSPMTLLRGKGDDLPLKKWLETVIWPIERQFTEDEINWGSQLAMLEMLKTGTTTYSDMYIYMDVIAKNVENSGIRANLSRGIIGFGSAEEKEKKLLEAMHFAIVWNKTANGRITTMMSPHSPYLCDPDYIKEIIKAAKEIDVPIQIHMSETRQEVEEHIAQYGLSPVEHMNTIGLFDHDTLIAHGVHLNEKEITILKDKDVKVSHNPGSNLKLGSGIAHVTEMLKSGITVSLGTDGAASNNNLDLFEEMRLAALIHKGIGLDPTAIPAIEALKMATINGAVSLFQEEHIGSLEAGKRADFVIIDIDQEHYYPKYNLMSHLVYSGSSNDVIDVFVDGEQVIKNKQALTLDEERIFYEVKRITELWK